MECGSARLAASFGYYYQRLPVSPVTTSDATSPPMPNFEVCRPYSGSMALENVHVWGCALSHSATITLEFLAIVSFFKTHAHTHTQNKVKAASYFSFPFCYFALDQVKWIRQKGSVQEERSKKWRQQPRRQPFSLPVHSIGTEYHFTGDDGASVSTALHYEPGLFFFF